MKKVYLNGTHRATVICPKCGFKKSIDARNLKDTQKEFKGECRCGEPYHYSIEFRRKHRKNVMLPGEYKIKKKGETGQIIVRELSLSGIRFETMDPHGIQKDDQLELIFNLNNPLKTQIRKPAGVVWVKNRLVGAYYLETKLYEKDLGFYLQS